MPEPRGIELGCFYDRRSIFSCFFLPEPWVHLEQSTLSQDRISPSEVPRGYIFRLPTTLYYCTLNGIYFIYECNDVGLKEEYKLLTLADPDLFFMGSGSDFSKSVTLFLFLKKA